MNTDTALKLQAWVDGELTGAEARAVETQVERDSEAQDFVAALRGLRGSFAVGEIDRPVPASREFYWSGIQRAIQSTDRPAGVRTPSLVWRLARVLAPAGVFLALGLLWGLPLLRGSHNAVRAEIDSPRDDLSSLSFRSEAEGMNVVWVSSE